MVYKRVDKETGKTYIQVTFKQPEAFETTFNKCVELVGGSNDNVTLRKAVEFVVQHPKSEPATGFQQFGLQEMATFGPELQGRLRDVLSSAISCTLVGERFAWIAPLNVFRDLLRHRLSNGKSTTIVTANPELHPTLPGDKFLRPLFEHICEGHWDALSDPAEALFVGHGIDIRPPYVCVMTEDELWIKHDLATTYIHGFFWRYDRKHHHGDFSGHVEDDLKTLTDRSRSSPGFDLVERYRPREFAAKSKKPKPR